MSLFAHLALTFGSHPEDLATEALNYVLSRSPAARQGVLQLVRASVMQFAAADLSFITQVSSKAEGRPDLAGQDAAGQTRLLIEAKFWAGFTEHQPLSYLDQLPSDGVLLVIGPHIRLSYMRRELLRRLSAADRSFEASPPADAGAIKIGNKHLVISSWRSILAAIHVLVADDPAAAADVAQLSGLCERMDSKAFLPITSDELTTGAIRRVHQFGELVDEVASTLSDEGLIDQSGVRAAGSNGWYGRYLRLRGVTAFLHVSTYKWSDLAPNPIWLTIFGPNWAKSDRNSARNALVAYESANPGTVHVDHDGFPTISIVVPIGVERHDVVSDLARQLRSIADIVAANGALSGVPQAGT